MGRSFTSTCLVLVLLSSISTIFAMPAEAGTKKRDPPYVPEPKGRGTVGLLSTCVTTFGLCVWTAMHPNLPRHLSTVGTFLQKLHWMFLAALFPEFIVLCAFSEWREAKRMQRKWCEEYSQGYNIITPGSKEDLMGAEGGFFISMEGFIIRNTTGTDTLTITPQNFQKCLPLMGPGSFYKKDINDKGKASNIAKCLVCTQAGWMVVQCIARLADGLPVTLLEIHTVIQVVMSGILYAFWWSKPLDVNVPIELKLPHELTEHQQMTLSDLFKDPAEYPESDDQENLSVTYAWLKVSYEISRALAPPTNPNSKSSKTTLFDHEMAGSTIAATLSILNGICHASAWNSHFPSVTERLLWQLSSLGIIVMPVLTYLLTLACDSQESFIGALDDLRHRARRGETKISVLQRALRERRDVARAYLLEEENRSSGEEELNIDKGPREKARPGWKYYFRLCMIDSVGLTTIGYTASIVYLTVEAFLSVRSLPEGSYKTPAWTELWPHL